jgi:alpha-L-rhamnosidase
LFSTQLAGEKQMKDSAASGALTGRDTGAGPDAATSWPRQWRGQWIWAADQIIPRSSPIAPDRRPRPPAVGLFRRRFHLDALPAEAPARLVADSRYRLILNGALIGHGPIRSQPRRMHFDQYDLAPHLQQGPNELALMVRYYGRANAFWMPAVGNATLGKSGVLAFEADLGDQWLTSDASWQGILSPAWRDDIDDPAAEMVAGGVPGESVDARQLTPDWTVAAQDWPPVQVLTPVHLGARGRATPPSDPYGPLMPNPLPPMARTPRLPHRIWLEQVAAPLRRDLPAPAARAEASLQQAGTAQAVAQAQLPISVPRVTEGHQRLRIDMGRMVAGHLEFHFDAPAGAEIDIAGHEERDPHPGPFGAHGGLRYITRGTADRFTSFDRQGFRYLTLLIADAAVTLTGLVLHEDLYPWSGNAGFTCSDPELTRLYTAARRTVALTSWDAFIDCPGREQRAWSGDSIIHLMTHLVANSDWRLAAHQLTLAAVPREDGILPMSVAGDVEAGQGFTIPDWSLHWLHGVWLMHRHAGDRAAIKRLMPQVEMVLRWFEPFLTPSGVLEDVLDWTLIDWSAVYTHGQSALLTALWARGLREAAQMAAWLGDRATQDWTEALLARVATGFEVFWSEARGTYLDHAIAGVLQPGCSQITGALAILAGLAPAHRHARIAQAITDETRLVDRSWAFGPEGAPPEEQKRRFGAMIAGLRHPDWDLERQIVRAEPFMSHVVHAALAHAGLAAHLPQLLRRWTRLLTGGHDTFAERWGGGSRCHGWSSCPAHDLVSYVLGITPDAPGYARARIAPCPGDLAQMAGSVPHPAGMIHLSLNKGQLHIACPVPFTLVLKGRTQDLPAGQFDTTI